MEAQIPNLNAIEIDLWKVRARLSSQRGEIVPETEARLWVVRAGFMPTTTGHWRPQPQSVEALEALLAT